MAPSKRSRITRSGVVPTERVVPESEIVRAAIKTDAAIHVSTEDDFKVPDVGQDRRALRDAGALDGIVEGEEELIAEANERSAVSSVASALDDPSLTPFERRLLLVVETLAARNQPVTDPRLAAALENLATAQLKGSKMIADEQRRSVRPSNEIVPMKSVYNPRGNIDFIKPKLKCRFRLPWEADDDSLTREEVELLNLIEAGVYKVTMTDKRKISLSVKVDYDVYDRPNMVTFKFDTVLSEPENMRRVPGGADLYREILKQNPNTVAASRKVATMEEEEAIVAAEEQIAREEAGIAAEMRA